MLDILILDILIQRTAAVAGDETADGKQHDDGDDDTIGTRLGCTYYTRSTYVRLVSLSCLVQALSAVHHSTILHVRVPYPEWDGDDHVITRISHVVLGMSFSTRTRIHVTVQYSQ